MEKKTKAAEDVLSRSDLGDKTVAVLQLARKQRDPVLAGRAADRWIQL